MKTKGMAIAAVALVGLVSVSANAAISNGSFEAGMTDWNITDNSVPFFPVDSYAAGAANTFGWAWANTPTDGGFSMVTGWDGAAETISISQDIVVDNDTLEFDYRAAWDMTFGATIDREFSVLIEQSGGGALLDSMLFLTAAANSTNGDTGALSGSMDLSAFAGQSVRLIFEWTVPEINTGPAQFDMDNIRLTSVPAPGALALFGLAGFALRRRR